MSKYGNGLDTVDVCKLERKDMREILAKYDISKEDAKQLEDMLTEAYFQLIKANHAGRMLEQILNEHVSKQEISQAYMRKSIKPDKYLQKFDKVILREESNA